MFYLRESEASATMFYLRESEASAANVFCSESKATATKRPVGTEITLTHWLYIPNLTIFTQYHNN
ncbi:hypothetical protein [Lysinibacillus xylanilyticus]|uniref:hypothetical protein n=1 Tax=Lysinibacillus xylanilyticus TaxID=582475 RepID=UPI00381CD253